MWTWFVQRRGTLEPVGSIEEETELPALDAGVLAQQRADPGVELIFRTKDSSAVLLWQRAVPEAQTPSAGPPIVAMIAVAALAALLLA
jgi:hypothetical protein